MRDFGRKAYLEFIANGNEFLNASKVSQNFLSLKKKIKIQYVRPLLSILDLVLKYYQETKDSQYLLAFLLVK